LGLPGGAWLRVSGGLALSRKKKKRSIPYKDVELNIMPFIDIFSMLNTFLLFSAVFLSVGILEVQIPFLSNQPPPDDPKDSRVFQVNVDVSKEQVEIQTSYTRPPEQAQKFPFPNNAQGIKLMHQKLAEIRKQNAATDKATVFSEDDVSWESLSAVLDGVMLRVEGDPVFAPAKDAKNREKAENDAKTFLYPKIVMGSVMLK
jgi:biopolymer transport protein ExbD